MAGEDDGRALIERVPDRRQRRLDARVVADSTVLERDVEVHAYEDALALEIEILDRQFGHSSETVQILDPSFFTSKRSRSTHRLE